MGFAPNDWAELISRLNSRTRDGKIDWVEHEFLAMPKLLRSQVTTAEYMASVGANRFALGSSDQDGRAPFFLDASRQGDQFRASDSIRSDSFMQDPELSRASRELMELWVSVRSYMATKDQAARDIIADLDLL